MTQEEYNKAPLLDQILYDETGMLVENHQDIAKAMEKYHQAKLELLGIGGVINCTELEPDFINALNQLIDTHREPRKKRF
jgi:hypothetical protein